MSRKIAIIQSNYIPWKGYFNIIKSVDEFVLLDDVQFTRRDWRNRNLIKTQAGLKWLTIPVDVKGKYLIDIKDVCTTGAQWRLDHWNQISAAYNKSPYFKMYSDGFKELYVNDSENNLSKINFKLISHINTLLNINTPVRWSMEFNAPAEKTERLVHICQSLKADVYVSGAAAKAYLDVDRFRSQGIDVHWADYSNYKTYNQLYAPFEHGVSVIDLLFNTGPESVNYLKQSI